MSLRVSVKSNVDEWRAKLRGANKQIDDAVRRALNRTATQARRISLQKLAKEIGLTQGKLAEYIDVKPANFSTLVAEVRAEYHTFNIASFGGKQTKRGVSSRAWGKRKTYAGTFLINGGLTAMVRTTPNRLPIRPVWGPRVHGEFVRNTVNSAMVQMTEQRFPENFRQQLRFSLRRIGITVE